MTPNTFDFFLIFGSIKIHANNNSCHIRQVRRQCIHKKNVWTKKQGMWIKSGWKTPGSRTHAHYSIIYNFNFGIALKGSEPYAVHMVGNQLLLFTGINGKLKLQFFGCCRVTFVGYRNMLFEISYTYSTKLYWIISCFNLYLF